MFLGVKCFFLFFLPAAGSEEMAIIAVRIELKAVDCALMLLYRRHSRVYVTAYELRCIPEVNASVRSSCGDDSVLVVGKLGTHIRPCKRAETSAAGNVGHPFACYALVSNWVVVGVVVTYAV